MRAGYIIRDATYLPISSRLFIRVTRGTSVVIHRRLSGGVLIYINLSSFFIIFARILHTRRNFVSPVIIRADNS